MSKIIIIIIIIISQESRNLIKGINTWAVLLERYLGPFLKWTREEPKKMDQRTRKLMTMHKALHSKDENRGRGLASIEEC